MQTKICKDFWLDLSELFWFVMYEADDECKYKLRSSPNETFTCSYYIGKRIENAYVHYLGIKDDLSQGKGDTPETKG